MALAVSQQQHMQGALPVLFASLFVTTGMVLAPPADSNGVYLSGPKIYTVQNIPSDTFQVCETDSFPVCPNTQAPDGSDSTCECTDRSKIRIGGVLHGVTTDSFWDVLFASAEQAAVDLSVQLELDRFEPEQNADILFLKMFYKILSLCESGVDGIFVSIPDDKVEEAVQRCVDRKIPVVSINAGYQSSLKLGLLHHIGMLEYNAGMAAGRRLLDTGISRAYCINHLPGLTNMIERCDGFEAAIATDPTVSYGGQIDVPSDNDTLFKKAVEDAVGDPSGDWDGIGFLLLGPVQVIPALQLKANHQEMKMGMFDAPPELYPALERNDILFGMDQQPYLQGYVPIPLLSYMAYTKQHILNQAIETGPSFVEIAPSVQQEMCESNLFRVCPNHEEEDMTNVSNALRTTSICLFAVQATLSVVFIIWTFYFRKRRIVKVSQPEFLVLIAFGCLVMGSSLIPMTVQGEYRYEQDPFTLKLTDEPNSGIRRADAACMAVPWLVSLGFVIVFSALFAKIYRVKKIFDAAGAFRKTEVSVQDASVIMIPMFLIEVILLLCWQLISPLRWERTVIETDENGYPTKSLGQCEYDDATGFLMTLVVIKLVYLIYALYLCYVTRNVPSNLAESKWISFSIISMFQTLLLAVPLLIIVGENVDAFHFVRSAIVFLLSSVVTLFIFVPKFYALHFQYSAAMSNRRFMFDQQHCQGHRRSSQGPEPIMCPECRRLKRRASRGGKFLFFPWGLAFDWEGFASSTRRETMSANNEDDCSDSEEYKEGSVVKEEITSFVTPSEEEVVSEVKFCSEASGSGTGRAESPTKEQDDGRWDFEDTTYEYKVDADGKPEDTMENAGLVTGLERTGLKSYDQDG